LHLDGGLDHSDEASPVDLRGNSEVYSADRQ
jgi:hypothetical protein